MIWVLNNSEKYIPLPGICEERFVYLTAQEGAGGVLEAKGK